MVIFTVQAQRLQVLLVRRPTGESEPFPACWPCPAAFGCGARCHAAGPRGAQAARQNRPAPTTWSSWAAGAAPGATPGWSVTQVQYGAVPHWPALSARPHPPQRPPWCRHAAPDTGQHWRLDVDTARASPHLDHATPLKAAPGMGAARRWNTPAARLPAAEPAPAPAATQIVRSGAGPGTGQKRLPQAHAGQRVFWPKSALWTAPPAQSDGLRHPRPLPRPGVSPRTFRSGRADQHSG